MVTGEIEFLQSWYRQQCDGEWEHRFGLDIGTLDNPGWQLAFDLEGTGLEGRTLDRQVIERSPDDWLQAWSDGVKFRVAAGPDNLGEAINAFRRFTEGG